MKLEPNQLFWSERRREDYVEVGHIWIVSAGIVLGKAGTVSVVTY
jgi:hypothetical protein